MILYKCSTVQLNCIQPSYTKHPTWCVPSQQSQSMPVWRNYQVHPCSHFFTTTLPSTYTSAACFPFYEICNCSSCYFRLYWSSSNQYEELHQLLKRTANISGISINLSCTKHNSSLTNYHARLCLHCGWCTRSCPASSVHVHSVSHRCGDLNYPQKKVSISNGPGCT